MTNTEKGGGGHNDYNLTPKPARPFGLVKKGAFLAKIEQWTTEIRVSGLWREASYTAVC